MTAEPYQPKGATKWVCRIGFWTSIFMSASAIAAFGFALTWAPARSGPFCLESLVGSCVTYPYTDVAAFVPGEYLWMYPAFLMALLFVALVGCIHHYVTIDKKVLTQTALSFAVVSGAVHTTNYFIQLAVIQPSLLKGELQGLSLFSQYNPHGIFIALEDLGYLMMGLSFLFIGAVFTRRETLERVIRIIFVAGSVLAVGSLVGLALVYGRDLEYRYEVVAIVVDWLTLIVAGILLGVFFRRAQHSRDIDDSR